MSDTITLAAIGDFAPIHSVTKCQPAVELVWQRLRAADLATANLETPLTDSATKADKVITFKADPSIAPSIAAAGIKLVSIANNHAMDYGAQGLFDTMETLKVAGIVSTGGGTDLAAALSPATVGVKGIKIACFGICSALPPAFAAAASRPGIVPLRAKYRFYIDSTTLDEQPGSSPWVETSVVTEDLDAICTAISNAKTEADLVIVHAHWGIPNGWCAQFQGPLADYQQPAAHAMIDAGADLILGHHAHTVQGMERYKNGFIAYCLGNCLFHSMGTKTNHGAKKLNNKYPPYNLDSLEKDEAQEAVILEADIDLELKQLQRVRFYPIAFNSEGDPEYLSEEKGSLVLQRLQKLSAKLGLTIEHNGPIGTYALR